MRNDTLLSLFERQCVIGEELYVSFCVKPAIDVHELGFNVSKDTTPHKAVSMILYLLYFVLAVSLSTSFVK